MENKHIKTFEKFSDIFKSKRQKEREELFGVKDLSLPTVPEKIKKTLTDKGWTNIGYDEDNNIIANHKDFGNGVRITDKYLK